MEQCILNRLDNLCTDTWDPTDPTEIALHALKSITAENANDHQFCSQFQGGNILPTVPRLHPVHHLPLCQSTESKVDSVNAPYRSTRPLCRLRSQN